MRSRAWLVTVIFLFSFSLLAQESSLPDPVLQSLQHELTRSFKALGQQPVPPYFLSYQLTDNRAISVRSDFGSLMESSDRQTRLLDLDLRVGDYKLDSTHPMRDSELDPRNFGSVSGSVPLEDGADALAVALWLETDSHYRRALQRFEAV